MSTLEAAVAGWVSGFGIALLCALRLLNHMAKQHKRDWERLRADSERFRQEGEQFREQMRLDMAAAALQRAALKAELTRQSPRVQ